jgi:hypothetical protein
MECACKCDCSFCDKTVCGMVRWWPIVISSLANDTRCRHSSVSSNRRTQCLHPSRGFILLPHRIPLLCILLVNLDSRFNLEMCTCTGTPLGFTFCIAFLCDVALHFPFLPKVWLVIRIDTLQARARLCGGPIYRSRSFDGCIRASPSCIHAPFQHPSMDMNELSSELSIELQMAVNRAGLGFVVGCPSLLTALASKRRIIPFLRH